MVEFNFNSQICTTKEQSERLIALGLKKETADMVYFQHWQNAAQKKHDVDVLSEDNTPAWSLHRLIEILDTNPFVFNLNCGYDNVIDHVEEYIRSGFIDTRYLEEWCLNEEE